MIKAVIFDLDGVIVDSEGTHHQIEREIFRKHGKELTPEMTDRFRGTTEKYFWGNICRELGIADYHELMEEKAEKYEQKLGELKLFPGVKDFIAELRRRKIKVALASSTQRHWIEKILSAHGLEFEVVVSGDEIEKSKPEPEIYLEAARRLGLRPEECLVIEDAINGIKAAKKAGMRCVAITNSFSREKLREADQVIDDLREFDPDWLEDQS
jgi:HAD superfamily hydrolase (TIGR01509 family)